MQKTVRLVVILFIVLSGLLKSSFAQTYPVQISAQLVPPYSGYLPDYADPTSEKLKVILQFNDFSQAQYNIKLKFEIKGNGFTLSTKTFFIPPPITLIPGQPLLLNGADLAPYLNTNNLDFVGINQSQYQQRMALPEGYYSICVKAYDYYNNTPIQLSNEACAQAWFTLSDPPYLNLPICGTAISPLIPQNILFQWTPVNMASPNSAFNTEYEFLLYEFRPDSNANANQVVLSTAPIFSTTTQQTFLNYGITETPLNLYMKYVWRVRAKDITGRDLFKNNGYSQICTFTYGTLKNVFGNTIGLNLKARALNHRTGECVFTKQSVYSTYLLQVRKLNTNYWFNYPNTSGTERIANLEPSTTYECRVRGEGTSLIGDWSNIESFKTLDAPIYGCNDNTQSPINSMPQPLPPSKAVIGLIIQSGQFEILTTQIEPSGQPGWYKGKGYAKLLGVVPVAVKWDNIYIDVDQRQQQGIIEALTKGIDKWLNDYDIKEAEENATYVEGLIDTIYSNGNQVCYKLVGSNVETCVPTPTNMNVMVIRDGEGNQYTMNLVPPPPKITGPTNYLNLSDDNLQSNDSLKVVFEASRTQNFGFDAKELITLYENYEAIKLSNGRVYFVPNKSVGEAGTDEVIASYTVIGNPSPQLSFKTQNGTAVAASLQGGKYKLTGIPANATCVYAYYNNQKIGKLTIISLKAISKKLVIVPVNSNNVNITAQNLNTIYKQANVSWAVSTAPNFIFDLVDGKLEGADANLLSKYSTEMRALRDAYKRYDSAYDKQAYYLFVVPNFSDANLKGYMVRGRALGFVASTGSATEDARVIAHELAHGAFGLEHTFPKTEKGKTKNLLDYGSGGNLTKAQWVEIKNGGFICSWSDSEEDGSSISSSCNFDISNKYIFAPNGKLFLAPNNTKILQVGSGAFLVNGFVYGFEINGSPYYARIPIINIALQSNANDFEGFYGVNGKFQISYIGAVPTGQFGYMNQLSNNGYKLFKILNASEVPGSNIENYDINSGSHLNSLILNNTSIIYSCETTINSELSSLQLQLIEKYKNFTTVHETYIYENGNLITLLANGKKYIRKFTNEELISFKQKVKSGELNQNSTCFFEKTISGYSLTLGYGNSVSVKYGGETAKQKSAEAFCKVFNNYLKDKGNLNTNHNQSQSELFEDGKRIGITSSNIWDLISNGITATKEFIQEAEIKPKYWNSDAAGYNTNWVNTPPLLSGIGNGVIGEIKEIPQLVTMGAELATSKDARDKLWTSLKGLSIDKIKNAASSSLNGWVDTYSQGGDPAWHQGGKDGVMVFTMLTPAGFLKGADEALSKNIDDAAAKVRKNSFKINPKNVREVAQSWTGDKKIRFDMADQFYINSGYTNYDNHLRGIDFDKPVSVVNKSKDEFLYQYCYLDKVTGLPNVGSYFYENANVDVSKLGFDVEGRVKVRVKLTANSGFLESSAADIEDWIPGSSKIFQGGELQFFSPKATYSEITIIN